MTDTAPAPAVEPTAQKPAASRELVAAVGIAAADLAASVGFYERVLGMAQLQTFSLPNMEEIVIGFPGSRTAAIVLMQYTDGTPPPTNAGSPVKLVLRVEDPTGVAARVRTEGLEVVREPEAIPAMGGAVVGFVKDPDGYLLELLQR